MGRRLARQYLFAESRCAREHRVFLHPRFSPAATHPEGLRGEEPLAYLPAELRPPVEELLRRVGQ